MTIKAPTSLEDGAFTVSETTLEEHLQGELSVEGFSWSDGWVAEVRSDGRADRSTLAG